MKDFYRTLTIVGLLGTTPLLMADSGVLLREADLRAEPQFQAAILQSVPPNARIDVGERRGSWRQLTLTESGQSGWVLDYKVRKIRPRPRTASSAPKATRKSDDSSIFSFAGLSRGATGLLGFRQPQRSANSPATVGIRGLSAVDLQNARPDPAQVERLNTFVSRQRDVELYASRGGLKAREVAYIDEREAQTQDTDDNSKAGRD